MSDADGRAGRIAIWAGVVAVSGGAAIAVWVGAATPGTSLPLWPVFAFGAVAVTGLYMCFASLYGWWPIGGLRRRNTSPADPKPPRKPVQPRYGQSSPYRVPRNAETPWVVQHRLGIFNPDGQAAQRVRVHLVSMEPYPRNVLNDMQPVIPYLVPLLSGGDGGIGITLTPGREELWVLGYTATGGDGTMNAGGFAVSDQRCRGLPWQFDQDERWRFVYQIVEDGSPPVAFSIVLYADDGTLRCALEG